MILSRGRTVAPTSTAALAAFTLALTSLGSLAAAPAAVAAAPPELVPDGAWLDEFTGDALAARWSVLNESPEQWSLAGTDDGALEVTSLPGDTFGTTNTARNVFLVDVPAGDFTAVTQVSGAVTQDFQGAGLIAWQDADNYVRAGLTHVSFAPDGPVVVESGVETAAQFSSGFTARPGSTGEVLRLERAGDVVTTSVWSDGAWLRTAQVTVAFPTTQVGLYALAAGAAASHDVSFDWFALTQAEGADVLPEGTFTLHGPDGLRHLAAADDGTLSLVDARPDRVVRLTATDAGAGALTLATPEGLPVVVDDGRLRLGATGAAPSTFRLTDAGGGRLVLRLDDDGVVTAGPDGVLVLGAEGEAVRLTVETVVVEDASLTIDGDATDITMSPDLYGLFYEDINYAADGGLYAELVRNRSFEFGPADNAAFTPLTAWEEVERDGATATAVVRDDDERLNETNRAYLALDATGAGAGVRNAGYNTGIPVVAGDAYDLSVWARSATAQTLTVQVEEADGTVRAAGTVDVDASDEWRRYEATLVADGSTTAGRLAVLAGAAGLVRLDMVSLFPQDTWEGPVNGRYGLRADLAEMIAAMEPSFLRFPGGCVTNVGTFDSYVESGYQDRRRTYQWKETIGPVEERPTNWNFWGYNQSYGLGYYEYFLFAEDLGATALPVLSVGANGCGSTIPEMTDDERIERWVDDTVDLIEFANGDVTTEWGAVRASLGHPEPFGMRYIGLGNEENTTTFEANFPRFRDAIESRYPDITVISNSGPDDAGARFDALWEFNRAQGVDMVDEHYYNDPSWFLENTHRYDDYDREGPHVFLGEYASRGNTFWNALAEAAYMTGLERNSDVVELASYAPLLANEDYVQWSPDAIWFDNDEAWGSVNYYVQTLFSTNRGHEVVPSEYQGPDVDVEAPDVSGGVFLSTWATSAAYDDLVVTAADGETLLTEDFADGAEGWTPERGEWTVVDGRYVQSSTTVEDARALAPDAYAQDWTNYTVELTATKLAGAEGFLVGFAANGAQDFYWWNLGGWGNTRSVLERANGARQGEVVAREGVQLVTGQEYDLRIEVEGRTIRAYLDGELHLEYTEPVPPAEVHHVVTRDTDTGDLLVKLVNVTDRTLATDVVVEDVVVEGTGTATEMTADALTATNTKTDPTNVVPVERELTGLSNAFTYELAPYSITFLRLPVTPADTTAPEVTLTADPPTPTGEAGWWTAPVTVTATATDDSGDAALEVDTGAGRVPYTGPVVLAADGTHTVRAWATDAAGNEAEGSLVVPLDATAPTSSAAVDVAARTVTITGADATSGVARVEHRLPGGSWTTTTGPVTVGPQATTVEHRAVDVAGNVGAVGAAQVAASPSLVGTRVLAHALPGSVRAGSPAVVVVGVLPDRWVHDGRLRLPSGAVEVRAGDVVVGTGAVVHGVGAVVLDTAGLAPGRNELTVTYGGDARFAASSATTSLRVRPSR